MDRGKGAVKLDSRTELFEGKVRFFAQQEAHLLPMASQDLGLAARIAMPGANVAGVSPLLKEFLHHSQRDLIPGGYLLASAFLTVIGGEDPFPQIER